VFVAIHYAIALGVVVWGILQPTSMPIGQKTAVAIFLLFLLASETLFLILLNGAVETLAGPLARWLDPLKALALTLLVLLPTASLIKFKTIGIQLKASDFWFVWNSAAQLAQESMAAEKAAALKLGSSAIILFALTWALLAWRRRRGRGDASSNPSFLKLASLLGLTLVGAFACHRLYPVIPAFAERVVPEIYWASQRFAPDPFASMRASTESTSSLSGVGPPIAPYDVDHTSGNRMNVVLIMLESVPWNRAPWAGERAGVMPNLAALAPKSWIFERAYTASTHSDYAQMAILSSLYPRKYDVHDYYTNLDYPRTLLWDALKPAGYATSLFSCQNEQWGNMLQYLNSPGLEVLRHSPSWPDARHKGSGAESKVYEETPVREWQKWRERGQEPYFTYLNFQSNHFSYEIPPEEERPYAPHEIDFPATFVQYPREKVDVMSNRFDNALQYADRWIGEVVQTLKERGEWERTILIVVSDHGEAFYEHGQPTHGTTLYEEQVRSLWLMRVPGTDGGRVVSPVSLLDLAPTALSALELPPHGNFQGRGDLLEAEYDGSGRVLPFTIQGLTHEDGVLRDGWKFSINWDRKSRSLYHLAEDPSERQSLAADFPGQADALQRSLGQILDRQLKYYAEKRWQEGFYPPPID